MKNTSIFSYEMRKDYNNYCATSLSDPDCMKILGKIDIYSQDYMISFRNVKQLLVTILSITNMLNGHFLFLDINLIARIFYLL